MTAVKSENRPFDREITAFMLFVHLGALFAFLPANFSWSAVGVAIFLHWFTGGLGITLGYHRLLTHRSFEAPKWLARFLAFCGTLAAEGGPLTWVGVHRAHHAYSDGEKDPHDSNKGFWWSHMDWVLRKGALDKNLHSYNKDLASDRFLQFLDKNQFQLQVVLGVLLYLMGGWPFVVWGVFVRLVAVYHCTWLVNSATHKFGYRNFDTSDRSTNCWWVALLTYGEGWHNNHHAYQYSARHGLRWWEIDITWMTIQFLQVLGLAKNVKLAPAAAVKTLHQERQ